MRFLALFSLAAASDFDDLFNKFNGDRAKYTGAELVEFRSNFARHFAERRDVKEEIEKLFWESEPMITEHKLKEIRDEAGSWQAEKSPRFAGWSVRDTKR